MSSFRCEKCGKDIIDTPTGYITGCEHYPMEECKICPSKKKKDRHCEICPPSPCGEDVQALHYGEVIEKLTQENKRYREALKEIYQELGRKTFLQMLEQSSTIFELRPPLRWEGGEMKYKKCPICKGIGHHKRIRSRMGANSSIVPCRRCRGNGKIVIRPNEVK